MAYEQMVLAGLLLLLGPAAPQDSGGPPFEIGVRQDRLVGCPRGTLVFGQDGVEGGGHGAVIPNERASPQRGRCPTAKKRGSSEISRVRRAVPVIPNQIPSVSIVQPMPPNGPIVLPPPKRQFHRHPGA